MLRHTKLYPYYNYYFFNLRSSLKVIYVKIKRYLLEIESYYLDYEVQDLYLMEEVYDEYF